MSNYIKSVNFTAKDTLPTGNANKVVRGAELDGEYSAIAVAVSTKADIASPTFTGTVGLPDVSISGAVTGTIDGGTY
jgi:hypothetical protein